MNENAKTPDVENTDVHNEDIKYIRVDNTTYKVSSFYNGDMPLLDLLKDTLKRDADAVLRQMANN
jgi:hypothetical protein